jgi:hypothetical protein
METIPSPVYIFILFGMWAFAGIRGGPFPKKLVTLYSAFFILGASSNYLVEEHVIPLSFHVIFQCMLMCALYDEAKEGRSIKAVNRLCHVLFGMMGLVMYSYVLDINYDELYYQTQNTPLNVHNLFSVILELYIIWLFVEIIDGARGDPIYRRIRDLMYYGLSLFAPNSESFHYQEEIKGFRKCQVG